VYSRHRHRARTPARAAGPDEIDDQLELARRRKDAAIGAGDGDAAARPRAPRNERRVNSGTVRRAVRQAARSLLVDWRMAREELETLIESGAAAD
jgi:hypothetical protein